MKLLMVISSLDGGGAERVFSDMANHWSSRGWDVVVTTFTEPEDEDFYRLRSSVRRIHLGRDPASTSLRQKLAGNFRRVIRLRRAMREEQPQAALSFIDTVNVTALLASRGLGSKVVVSERTHPGANASLPRAWQRARRYTYPLADVVVAQTAEAARWLEAECGREVKVVPNSLREMTPLAIGRETLVVSVGRLSAEKGFDLLLRAFAKMRLRHPGWRMAIVGEGPERAALEALRDSLGLSSFVVFPGRARDIEHWYARAGILAQASRFEGFPNVILEAMALGTPVISTDCQAGPADLVRHDVDGLLVPVEDVDALAAALSELAADEPRRRRLGTAALEVRDRFAAERILEQWETLLRPSAPTLGADRCQPRQPTSRME